jgi:hypothetical protein
MGHRLYSSPKVIRPRVIKSKGIRWAKHVAHVARILVEKCEAKSLLVKRMCSWEDNIKMKLGESGLDSAGSE